MPVDNPSDAPENPLANITTCRDQADSASMRRYLNFVDSVKIGDEFYTFSEMLSHAFGSVGRDKTL